MVWLLRNDHFAEGYSRPGEHRGTDHPSEPPFVACRTLRFTPEFRRAFQQQQYSTDNTETLSRPPGDCVSRPTDSTMVGKPGQTTHQDSESLSNRHRLDGVSPWRRRRSSESGWSIVWTASGNFRLERACETQIVEQIKNPRLSLPNAPGKRNRLPARARRRQCCCYRGQEQLDCGFFILRCNHHSRARAEEE